jgi:hypothetical protein
LTLTGAGRVEALLSSQQFGELSAEHHDPGRALEGRLRSSALSLTAFRDLVPGWQVEDGTIEGDLRLRRHARQPRKSAVSWRCAAAGCVFRPWNCSSMPWVSMRRSTVVI